MATYILVDPNRLGCMVKLQSRTDNLSFCPTIFLIGTYKYKLAKFLAELLNQLFHHNKEVKEVSAFNQFMMSYDVCNLFTNILTMSVVYSQISFLKK